ncbi:MAG: hemolysin family protein [Hyphomonas sp.]|uniref:hemolysin family protein n=1 Tax=Hyphomonas sp. TaxID=87 RepID=UPI003528CDFD
MTEFFILIALIVVNGIFAMSELSIVSARVARLKRKASLGDKGAQAVIELQEDPSRFLSTVQIGITLVGIVAGAYGATAIADKLAPLIVDAAPGVAAQAGSIAFGIVIVLTTYLSLVIGELVPKRIALTAPEAIATAMAGPMKTVSRVAFPAVWLLRVSTEGLVRLLGMAGLKQDAVTEEEIHAILEAGASSGVIDQEEQRMMRGVMRLADRDVRSIMTPRPDIIWLDINQSWPELRQQIVDSGLSRFPVADRRLDRAFGAIQTKDILRADPGAPGFDLRKIARPVPFVPETLSVMRLLESMQDSEVRMAFVVDEHGSIQGIVTAADLLGAIAGDSAFSPLDGLARPVQRDDGSWLVDGMMPIEDLEILLSAPDFGEADGGFTTVGGLVIHQLERLAKTGDVVSVAGFRFEVVDVDGRRIDSVLVSTVVPQAG